MLTLGLTILAVVLIVLFLKDRKKEVVKMQAYTRKRIKFDRHGRPWCDQCKTYTHCPHNSKVQSKDGHDRRWCDVCKKHVECEHH